MGLTNSESMRFSLHTCSIFLKLKKCTEGKTRMKLQTFAWQVCVRRRQLKGVLYENPKESKQAKWRVHCTVSFHSQTLDILMYYYYYTTI